MIRRHRLTSALTLPLLLLACTREELPAPRHLATASYTVAEARACYEQAIAARTRSSDDGEAPLTAGFIRPAWEEGVVSIDPTLYSADVPVAAEYVYYRLFDADSLPPVPLPVKLVTVKNPASEGSCCYLRYYLPDAAYAAAHTADDYDGLLNSRPKTGYTGLSLYASLDGYVVAAGRYVAGRLMDYAFLYDETRTDEQNDADMERLLEGVRIGRGRSQRPTTRNETPPDPEQPIDIEVVVVEGRRPDPKPDLRFELPFPSSDWGDVPGGSGGDGSGSGGSGGGSGGAGGSGGEGDGNGASDGSKGYRRNPEIKYEDQTVEDLLDYLENDCMGSTLIRSLNGVTVLTGQDRNTFNCSNHTIYLKCDDRYGYRDYAFLEEMIHAYQYQYYGKYINPQRTLNNEIEAKVGWLLYRKRMQNPLTPGQKKKAFNHMDTQQAFDFLTLSFLQHAPSFNPQLQEQYDIAAQGLRALPTYANIPYLQGDFDFDALYKLMEDC